MAIEFNRKPGLVIYLTVGDPDLATTREVALAAIDAGVDVLELGVPFSDPVADGPVIQRATDRALAQGTRLEDVLALAAELRALRPFAGLVIFSYFNPVLRYGLERFCARAAGSGVDAVLITDLIVEEAEEYLTQLHHYGLKPIFLAAPTSTDHRLKMIAGVSEGFVYAISRVGITGAQQDLAADARRLVERLRRFTHLPIAVGFGISRPEHVAAVGEFADAAVIGSAIVSLIEQARPGTAPAGVSAFLQGLRQAGAPNVSAVSHGAR
ncbi:MAG TPA: tryptophan synthase subunit alpha [Acidobacteriaceae bacterium]|nr:tryptophan synthase subunit alpha [Acidobacteriaceae bacterium]